MSKKKKEEKTITVHVDLTEKPERWPKIVAYLLTRTGRLLTRQEFRPDKEGRIGEARLSVEEIQKAYTLKIGPDVDEVNRLERYRPYVKTFELAEEVTIEIPKEIWICWLKSPYLVTGTVKKVLPGKLAPICVGEVEIFDVDMKHCILKLPDHIIEKIRDGIIDIIVDPPPIDPRIIWKDKDLTWWGPDDDDWCGTGPKPPFPPKAVDVREKLQSLPKEWSFAVKRYDRLTDTKTMANVKLQSLPPQERTTFLNSMAVEGVTTSQVLYSNTKQFRDLLIDKLFYFKYWICWWPWIFWLWWPYCGYSLELLGVAALNPDGSFSKNVWLSVCRQDKPDLWFMVKQTIDGVERIIYARYPVPCNTYWNHPSGDPVDLLVSHPLAETCVEYIPGIPDPYVMPMGVYEDEWYQVQDAHIKAHCDPSTPLPATCGLYGGTDPYGTRLDLRMQFHDAMYGYYYRWSYRRHGETNWVPLNTPITHRHVTWSSGKWVIVADNFGPMNVGSETGLYKVPDPSKAWLSNRDDLAYAIWNTAVWDGSQYLKQVSDGKYDLQLEMFNASGNKVTPSAAGFKYILPTAALGDVDDALYVEAGGELIMHLHVDNTDTVAEISSVSLNGAAAGECQFLEYKKKDTDNVEIEYVAYHPATPENFLSHYVLSVTRGISGTLVQSITNSTPERTPIEAVYTVGDLLGSFDQCAFSVWLHTYPRTRDGHSRIREYEDSDRSSFALTKNKGPP